MGLLRFPQARFQALAVKTDDLIGSRFADVAGTTGAFLGTEDERDLIPGGVPLVRHDDVRYHHCCVWREDGILPSLGPSEQQRG